MIDCHTHAFPALGEHVDRALDRLSPDAGFIARDALEDLRGLVGGVVRTARGLARKLPKPPSLDVEAVARAGQRVPGPLWKGVEAAVSLGLFPQVALTADVDELLASMDEAGIERAVVISSPPLASNEWLLREAWPRARSRLIPVAMMPELPKDAPEPQWAEALEGLARAGARGFKLHPNRDGLGPEHPAYRAAFEVAQREGKFIVLHTGTFNVVGYRKSGAVDPTSFEPLFHDFPSVRVCLAHMNRERPEVAWELMRRHDQLFADTSWQPREKVKTALREVGARRVLLGSDWPLLHAAQQTDAVQILREVASDKELERVVKYTPLVFLGEA